MINDFDEIIELPLADEIIQYGIVYGSNTIIFIKAGETADTWRKND